MSIISLGVKKSAPGGSKNIVELGILLGTEIRTATLHQNSR
jgi:hypothetical protein